MRPKDHIPGGEQTHPGFTLPGERELLSLACRPVGWESSSPPEGWPLLLQLARRHGLLGALYRAAEGCLPHEGEETCRAVYQEQVATALLARRQLIEVAAACAGRDIPVVVLKGGAALLTWYPDPACRRIADLDLLVPADSAGAAREVMTELGYSPVANRSSQLEEDALARLTHLRPFQRDGRMRVELHVSVLQGRVGAEADRRVHEELFRRAVPVPGVPGLLRPSDVDFALHTLAHYSRDLDAGFASLKGLTDLVLVLGKARQELWAELWERAERWAVFPEAVRGIAVLREYGGLEAGLPLELERLPPERLLYEGAPDPGAAGRRYAEILSAVREVPGFRARVRFLRELVLPSAEKLRHRYAIPERTSLAPYYARHAWGTAGRVLRAVRRRTADRTPSNE